MGPALHQTIDDHGTGNHYGHPPQPPMLQCLDIQLIPNKDTHEKVKFDFGEDREVESDVSKGGA